MHFFTEAQFQQLLENSQPDNAHKDNNPVVKLYIPGTDCTWLISEMFCTNRNIAWGLFNAMGCIPVLGYIDLNDLASMQSRFGPVQADPSFEGKYPMSVYSAAATICDRITEKEALLRKCYAIYLSKIKSK